MHQLGQPAVKVGPPAIERPQRPERVGQVLLHPQAKDLLLGDVHQPQRALKQSIEVHACWRLVRFARLIIHVDHPSILQSIAY